MEFAFCVECVKSTFLSSPVWSMEYEKHFVSICRKILGFNLYLACPLWMVGLLDLYYTCLKNGHRKKPRGYWWWWWWWWWLRLFNSCLLLYSPPVLDCQPAKNACHQKKSSRDFHYTIWLRTWLLRDKEYVSLRKMWIFKKSLILV